MQTVVNLSEQTGKESLVTNGYQTLVRDLDRGDITYVCICISSDFARYKAFDFHAKCHGMKWEHISELIDELDFNAMGYLWTLGSEVIREQQGVFRTK